VTETALKDKYHKIFPQLTERQRRLVVAADAQALGRGGIKLVRLASGMAKATIHKGIKELEQASEMPKHRSRIKGGGRKRIEVDQPGVTEALDKLVDPEARGDPETALRWTIKSSRELAEILKKQGYRISHTKVGEILSNLGYSLQANSKTHEGDSHPDRDAQFGYINEQVKTHVSKGIPVISVDTKKKELIGNYKNFGKTWRPAQKPVEVNVYDFKDDQTDKAVPYGIYDLKSDTGWVNVGISKDTAQFSVESIRKWWKHLGSQHYPQTNSLLITADCGGSNGRRNRLWKKELQTLSNETGLIITVCHFPPGTSKWNKIEHKLFCYISMNWRGRPLTNLQTIVNLIGATKTRSGLKVYAMLDKHQYQSGIKISDEEMKQLNITPHEFHGEWNYTIKPSLKV
jgi:hypothetical protein